MDSSGGTGEESPVSELCDAYESVPSGVETLCLLIRLHCCCCCCCWLLLFCVTLELLYPSGIQQPRAELNEAETGESGANNRSNVTSQDMRVVACSLMGTNI